MFMFKIDSDIQKNKYQSFNKFRVIFSYYKNANIMGLLNRNVWEELCGQKD